MSAAPVSSVAVTPSVQSKSTEPARVELREAAQQFEAVLLRQMLASARATSFGGGESLFGKSDHTFCEMRDARFAEIASSSGQLGFAAAIERQLARHLPKEPS